ncbi:Protein TolB [uncultured archaeon]|nr:Protein TolB [uncultured archaeon]
MKVSNIFIYLFLISLFSAPVSADLIIESNATVNIPDKDFWSTAISPDGTTIAYVSYDISRNQQIFTIKTDGSQRKQLTNDLNRKWDIEWLTDELSFMSYDNVGIEKIFIVSLDGSKTRKLLNETIRQGKEPIKGDRFWGAASWNPENEKILFTLLGKNGYEDIFEVNIDGTGLKMVINDTSRQWNPRWSPDGTSFVFVSQDKINLDQLYTANADGTGITQITDDAFKKYNLNWGKNGILFVSTETQLASSEKIFIINPDGTGKRRLIEDGFNQRNPMWSRDGNTILYEATDIKGNKLIELLNLQKSEVISAVSPAPTVAGMITPTARGTPVIEKTPRESTLEELVLPLIFILGLIVIIILAFRAYTDSKPKKK